MAQANEKTSPATTTAHTPRPWVASPQISPDFDTEPTWAITTEDNTVIAMVYPDGHPESVEPNARLIATAPELLGIAEDVLDWIEDLPLIDPGSVAMQKALRTIIAKAKGKAA